MEIPPPSVPDQRLADWRQADQTIDSPFSTPMVSAHTHTVVYEESTQRERIFEQCGIDYPWRFFFASRIQLEPPQPPNPVLTSLIRKRVDRAFVDRLAGRGLQQIKRNATTAVPLGGSKGRRFRYAGRLDLDFNVDGDDLLCLPIEGYIAVWTDDSYRLAGGAYPAGPADSGPDELVDALSEIIEPTAAREELLALIAGCCES